MELGQEHGDRSVCFLVDVLFLYSPLVGTKFHYTNTLVMYQPRIGDRAKEDFYDLFLRNYA